MTANRPTIPDEPQSRREMLYASIASFTFHFCMILLIPLILSAFAARDRTPPSVATVSVIDDADTIDPGDGLPANELEARDDPSDAPLDPLTPEEFRQVDPTNPKVELSETKIAEQLKTQSDAGAKAAQRVSEALDNALDRLNENLAGGAKSGGSGPTGRAGRAARWVLKFNTRSGRDYLDQLGAIGAEIAFATEGGKLLYFSELESASPRRQVRDLDNENRIYWVDASTLSVANVCRELGIPPSARMIAFLPLPLEEKMARLETQYQGKSEEEIQQTVFAVINGNQVKVIDQTLRQ